jgi:hypothetical protein
MWQTVLNWFGVVYATSVVALITYTVLTVRALPRDTRDDL